MTGAGPALLALQHAARALRDELAEFHLRHPRRMLCLATTLAVTLSVIAALLLRVDAPWWAAISAFVSLQASAPASFRRGVLRITGTLCGAALGLLAAPWVIEDQAALCILLFTVSAAGVLGLQVSSHGYAWLLAAVTADMVVLAAQADPFSALSTAGNRSAEVAIGTLAAMLAAWLLIDGNEAKPTVDAPGWTDLTGAQWPAMQHALIAGIGVTCVPLAWNLLALPSLSQTAITVAAVMAVPTPPQQAALHDPTIITRALHRLLGCLCGGVIGLACIALSIDSLLPWLALLTAGVWIGTYLQSSTRGIGYLGIQGTVVFMMTMVQGFGPPDGIMEGIDRLAGITGGLAILLAVTLLLAPANETQIP